MTVSSLRSAEQQAIDAIVSQKLDAMIAAMAAVQPIMKQVDDCERRLGEVQQALAEAQQQHTSLTETNSALLRSQASYGQRLEQLQADTEKLEQELTKAKARAQQELEAVTHKRDEALATYNRILASMKTMLDAQQ